MISFICLPVFLGSWGHLEASPYTVGLGCPRVVIFVMKAKEKIEQQIK
jgi:hypothetical protein